MGGEKGKVNCVFFFPFIVSISFDSIFFICDNITIHFHLDYLEKKKFLDVLKASHRLRSLINRVKFYIS